MWRCRAADASRVRAAPCGSAPARWRRSSNQMVARQGRTTLGHLRWGRSMVHVAVQAAAMAAVAGRFAAHRRFGLPRRNPCRAAAAATAPFQTESRVAGGAGHHVVWAAPTTAAAAYLRADRRAAQHAPAPGVRARTRRGRARLIGYVDSEPRSLTGHGMQGLTACLSGTV
jgi:hypothetical protein